MELSENYSKILLFMFWFWYFPYCISAVLWDKPITPLIKVRIAALYSCCNISTIMDKVDEQLRTFQRSINNADKLCKEVGEFINENHSRRSQVIGERSRSKYQTVNFVGLGRIMIRTIMVSEILHEVELKEFCMILQSHKILFNLRMLSYDTSKPYNYHVE